MIWPVGQGLRKHRTEGLVIRKTWEEVCRWIFRNGRSVQIFLSQVKYHQRASMAEEALDNQMAKMARPMDGSHPLSAVLSVCTQHALVQCDDGCKNGDYS